MSVRTFEEDEEGEDPLEYVVEFVPKSREDVETRNAT